MSSNYIEYKNNKDKDKTSIYKYIDKTKQYLSGIINDHKTQGEWKIYVTIAINLISSKNSNETHTMDTGSDNMEIMIGNET